ncbi:MAG TPA: glycosyltransferase family 39 protein [Armatimonadota bacterium]|nr:glycosyltransferase family 39 protein [Armatimonadota bacterium]
MSTLLEKVSSFYVLEDSNPKTERRISWLIPFEIVILIATALRIYQLGAENLWIDEAFSLRDVSTDFTIAKAARPLYFWILTPFYEINQEDWFLRIPAVLFGIATTALIFHIGRMIWDTKAGTIAGLLAAVSPLYINHSQEVRMYTFLTLTAVSAMYFTIRTLQTWHFRYMLATAVCLWFSVLTQPVSILLMLPINTMILYSFLQNRRPLLPWILTQLMVIIAWLPWLSYAFQLTNYYAEQKFLTQMYRPGLIDIHILWSKFIIGEYGHNHTLLHSLVRIYAFILTVSAAVFVAIDRKRIETGLIALWLLLPTIIVLVMSATSVNTWVVRYMLFISPAFLLLVGAALSKIKSKLVLVSLCAVLLIPSAVKLFQYYTEIDRPQWRLAVQYIMDRERPQDKIAVYRHSNSIVFDHYYKGRLHWDEVLPTQFLANEEDEFEEWNEQTARKLLDTISKTGSRHWLVLARIPRGSGEYIDAVLQSDYRVLEHKKFNEVSIYLFENKAKSAALQNNDLGLSRNNGSRM